MPRFINPHEVRPMSFVALVSSILKNYELIFQMTKREVVGRYKGSILGIAWSFFNPILMLTIYTFVFSVVFKSRWGSTGADSKAEFALILFVGMIIYGFFAETINGSPGLILSNVNYVKKVVFPLEILSIVSCSVALFHAAISFSVLLVALLILSGGLNWTVLFLPLVIMPLLCLILGLSWFLAALGVYVRDIGQTIGILTTLLLFLSPVFYPISAVPPQFQFWILLNPLSFVIGQARDILIFGVPPDWFWLGIYFMLSTIVMLLGFAWFQKTRKGFADVL